MGGWTGEMGRGAGVWCTDRQCMAGESMDPRTDYTDTTNTDGHFRSARAPATTGPATAPTLLLLLETR